MLLQVSSIYQHATISYSPAVRSFIPFSFLFHWHHDHVMAGTMIINVFLMNALLHHLCFVTICNNKFLKEERQLPWSRWNTCMLIACPNSLQYMSSVLVFVWPMCGTSMWYKHVVQVGLAAVAAEATHLPITGSIPALCIPHHTMIVVHNKK